MFTLNRCIPLLMILTIAACASAGEPELQGSTKKMWDGTKKQRASAAGMDFDAIKKSRSERLALEIKQLTTFKTCVDDAADQLAMAACQKANRAAKNVLKKPTKGQIDAEGMRQRLKGKN